jgi:transcriptional regulator with XRE-family HTH domain
MNGPGDMGKRIRALRTFRGMDTKELADMLRISQENLTQIEVCSIIPNPTIIERLCGTLGTSAEFLLGLRIKLKNGRVNLNKPRMLP